MKFIVKDCDPGTGEPDDDGYNDEYVVSIKYKFMTWNPYAIAIFLNFSRAYSHWGRGLPAFKGA